MLPITGVRVKCLVGIVGAGPGGIDIDVDVGGWLCAQQDLIAVSNRAVIGILRTHLVADLIQAGCIRQHTPGTGSCLHGVLAGLSVVAGNLAALTLALTVNDSQLLADQVDCVRVGGMALQRCDQIIAKTGINIWQSLRCMEVILVCLDRGNLDLI